MLESSSLLYKMIILYMLDRMEFPLTNSQITTFLLDREYTSYFHVQEALSDLEASGLIEQKKDANSTFIRLAEEGKKTLSYFEENIPINIRRDIDDYLRENGYELKNEHSVTADYYRNAQQEYTVRCRIREKEIPLIQLELTVPTEEIAGIFARNWPGKSTDIYVYLMDVLSDQP